jgi:hypothetical protein
MFGLFLIFFYYTNTCIYNIFLQSCVSFLAGQLWGMNLLDQKVWQFEILMVIIQHSSKLSIPKNFLTIRLENSHFLKFSTVPSFLYLLTVTKLSNLPNLITKGRWVFPQWPKLQVTPFYKLFHQRLKWEEYIPFTYYLLGSSLDKTGYSCSRSVLIVD